MGRGRRRIVGAIRAPRRADGTRVAALFYSVVETCKLLDIDPAAFMNEAVRRRLPDPDDVLTPHAWRDELRARGAPG